MIASVADKRTAQLAARQRVRKFANIERVALRKIEAIRAAHVLEELRMPPGNRL